MSNLSEPTGVTLREGFALPDELARERLHLEDEASILQVLVDEAAKRVFKARLTLRLRKARRSATILQYQKARLASIRHKISVLGTITQRYPNRTDAELVQLYDDLVTGKLN